VSEIAKVSVTITADGQITDITVGARSIAAAIPRGNASLTLGDGGSFLSIALVPDEIIVKGKSE
jgi:hypothetical protein